MSPVMTLTCAWAGAATQIDAIKTALQIKTMAKALQGSKTNFYRNLRPHDSDLFVSLLPCPAPPKRLPLPIDAGERDRAKHRSANRRCPIITSFFLDSPLASSFGHQFFLGRVLVAQTLDCLW